MRSLQLANTSLYDYSLIIDQIYDSDYSHLRPAEDDLFSDEEGDGVGGGTGEGGEQQREERNGHEDVNGKVRKVSLRFEVAGAGAGRQRGPRFGDGGIRRSKATELHC